MPETVKLGDRYWLVLQLHELEQPDQKRVVEILEHLDRSESRDELTDCMKLFQDLVRICVVDDVDPESVEKLDAAAIIRLVNAIAEEYDTATTL